MQFTIISLRCSGASGCQEASQALQDIVGFTKRYSNGVVDTVRRGGWRKITLIDTMDGDDLKQLGVYFEMTPVDGSPITKNDITQLKLWTVSYYRRGSELERGLVLAETGQKAEASVTSAIQTFGDVIAEEIREPFFNGQILTTKIISK